MKVWFGTGLQLKDFLELPHNERRARLWELSDVDQLLYIERRLDSIEAILGSWPPESALPEVEPYGGQDVDQLATVERFPEAIQQKHFNQELTRLLRGPVESPDGAEAEIISFRNPNERNID